MGRRGSGRLCFALRPSSLCCWLGERGLLYYRDKNPQSRVSGPWQKVALGEAGCAAELPKAVWRSWSVFAAVHFKALVDLTNFGAQRFPAPSTVRRVQLTHSRSRNTKRRCRAVSKPPELVPR